MSDDGVRCAAVGDGSHVAFQVSSSGPIDLLEIGSYGTAFPFGAAQSQPRWAQFEEHLGRFCRLIKFDFRGIGFSDKIPESSLESWIADALAVLEAADCYSASVLAAGPGALAGIELAARHPDRVSALMLVNGYPRAQWAPDYTIGVEVDAWREAAAVAEPGPADNDSSDIDVMAPSLSDDRLPNGYMRISL